MRRESIPRMVSPRLESFALEPWPKWTYAVAGGKIVHELFVPHETAAVVLRWRWEGEAVTPLRLHVRPFFSGRDFHSTHHENSAFGFSPKSVPEGQRWHLYDGIPEVTARSNGIYHHEPCWYRSFQYDEELARGLDAVEDLAAPGRYEFDLSAGQAVLIFSAEGLGLPLPAFSSPVELAEKLARDESTRRMAFATPRQCAGDAYLVRRGSGKTIIAGYPWFGDWGRDTFIAMRGLCLATGRLEEARDILAAWAKTVSQGMLPNRFPDDGDAPEYNSVDSSLWYVIVVYEFLAMAAGDPALTADKEILLATVEAILTGYFQGTRYGIRGDLEGLLSCGEPGVQLTWMDAKVGRLGRNTADGQAGGDPGVVAKRTWLGQPAQFQMARAFRARMRRFSSTVLGTKSAAVFMMSSMSIISPARSTIASGPNQIFAVGGLPLALIEGKQAQRIVQVVQDRLWTPMGPRSLAPGEKDYAPHYGGTQAQRDGEYHQGTVWPWVAGPLHRGLVCASTARLRMPKPGRGNYSWRRNWPVSIWPA